MDKIKQMITSIDLDNLLKLFDLQIAIGVLLFFVLFRSILSNIVIRIYYKIVKSDKNAKDSAMYKPLNTFFVLLGVFCMINILPTSNELLVFMDAAFAVVLIYFVTRALSTLLTEDSILGKKVFKNSKNTAVNRIICVIAKVILWSAAFLIIVAKLGFDISIFSGLFAGLGVASAAAALAAQDTVKSILSGMAILTDKPFVIGDWIEVDKYQGTVIDITFRSTRIKSYDNSVVTIPNSTITTNYVVNWNRLTSRRFDCILNLALDTTSDKIQKMVKEIKLVLQNDPNVIKETVEVNLHEITNTSCNIKIYLYVREAEYAKFLKAKQNILCNILYLFEKENIELAYPTQNIYVKRKDEIEA
ncbi:MAG: mechanosensitive ion channel family protein [Clostridia bacterium]|nr:mechanosensitive ion channel family protein [Clostridia bacterium]